MNVRTWLPVLALAAAPVAVAGQDLAARITGGGDGVVRIRYEVRDGVEICESGIRMNDDRMMWGGRGSWRTDRCLPGPVEVEVTVRDGRVRGVDVLRLDEEPTARARDLGEVDSGEAARALLRIAGQGGGRGVEDAVFPAMIADADGTWRQALELAENRDLGRDVRKSALFWVGQEAAAQATDGLARVAGDEDEDQDIRDAAVFALSQRPDDEGVPILMDLARTAREAETRRSAFFWLAQSDDDRVVAFFREVLTGGR